MGEALAVTPRRLPAGLPFAMALALTDAPSDAALAGGGPIEGARRLLLLAPGPELVVLDVSDDAARPQPCRCTAQDARDECCLCLTACIAGGHSG